MESSIESIRFASGTSLTVTPRADCTRKGKVIEVKSPAAMRTFAESGSEAATIPTSPDTVAPIETLPGSTIEIFAQALLALSTYGSKSGAFKRPSRQESKILLSSPKALRGGTPREAVFRKPGSRSKLAVQFTSEEYSC